MASLQHENLVSLKSTDLSSVVSRNNSGWLARLQGQFKYFNYLLSVLFFPTANLRCGIPIWFLTLSTAFSTVIGVFKIHNLPAPINGLFGFSFIGVLELTEKASDNQSLTPPWTASQLVCGEKTAILFLIHFTTIRSFHDL